ITIISGWNYYLGSDAAAGAGQYDFETVVTHELGHALGLGHSGDTGSVMYPYLAAGQARHDMTTADLAVIEVDDGDAPEGLMAAPIAVDAAAVTPAPTAAAIAGPVAVQPPP